MAKTEFQAQITLGEQTFIAPDYAQTRLHNGNGSKAYVARIVGTSQQYGLKREFVKPDRALTVGKGKSGLLGFPDLEPGIYEYRQFCVNDKLYNWHRNGFFVVTGNGVAEIDPETASEMAKKLDSKDWNEIASSIDNEEVPNETNDAQEGAEEDSQTEPI